MALTEAQRNGLLAVALGTLAVAVFWPIRGHDFLLYDDDLYVTANPMVALGLTRESVHWAFTSFHGANWFPLTRLSWMLDWQLHGAEARGFHTTSLLLHALTSSVLFLALARLTRSPGRSAFVAAVFAVHPLQVESVAWIATRKDTLSALCFALALLAYATPRRGDRGGRRIAAVFACLALGLLAKQMLVTLPFVLLLLDDWPLWRLRTSKDAGRFDSRALRRAIHEKLPLFVLVALFCAVALVAQRAGGALASFDALPLGERLANAASAGVAYLGMAFWPQGLAVFYPHPEQGIALWHGLAAAALLLGLTLGALRSARLGPSPLAVGWFWFLGMLVPVIGLVQVGSQALADRYTHLPLIGLAIALAWGAPQLLARLLPDARARRATLVAAGTALLAALVVATSVQLRHWRDTEALMRHALAVTRANYVAHAYLGVALVAKDRAAEAVRHWQEAARLRPGYLDVANNLAWLLATSADPAVRDPDRARVHANRAARIAPDEPAVLDTLAAAQAAAGLFAEAQRTAGRARRLAEQRGDTALARQIATHEAHYRAGRAWVEPR